MAISIKQCKCMVEDNPSLHLKRYLTMTRLYYRDAQWLREWFQEFFPLLKKDASQELYYDLSTLDPACEPIECSDLNLSKLPTEVMENFEKALENYKKALEKRSLNHNEEVSSREFTILNPKVHPELFPVVKDSQGMRLVILWGLESDLPDSNVDLDQFAAILREGFCDQNKKGSFWKMRLNKLSSEASESSASPEKQPKPPEPPEPLPKQNKAVAKTVSLTPFDDSENSSSREKEVKDVPVAPRIIPSRNEASSDSKPNRLKAIPPTPSVNPQVSSATAKPSPESSSASKRPNRLKAVPEAELPASPVVNGHAQSEPEPQKKDRPRPQFIGGHVPKTESKAEARSGKKQVLLVDDEEAFLNLMTELLLQADYEVHPVNNPVDAIRMLRKQRFDLICTDNNMPDLKGLEFIDKCKSIDPNVPIIMISGYIDMDAASKLREMRIEVFRKPINVVMLLKKAKELIKQSEAFPIRTVVSTQILLQQEVSIVKEKKSSPFESFGLKSESTRQFKAAIESLGKEVPNLVLVGPEGTHFLAVCEDIANQMDSGQYIFINLQREQISSDDILPMIEDLPSQETLVFVVPDAHLLTEEEREVITKLYQKAEPYQDVGNPIKYIACYHEELDSIFEKGLIDVGLYLILGQKEIFVPGLNDAREEIPYLTYKIMEDHLGISSSKAASRIDEEALKVLSEADWERNYEQLREVIVEALNASGSATVTKERVQPYLGAVKLS